MVPEQGEYVIAPPNAKGEIVINAGRGVVQTQEESRVNNGVNHNYSSRIERRHIERKGERAASPRPPVREITTIERVYDLADCSDTFSSSYDDEDDNGESEDASSYTSYSSYCSLCDHDKDKGLGTHLGPGLGRERGAIQQNASLYDMADSNLSRDVVVERERTVRTRKEMDGNPLGPPETKIFRHVDRYVEVDGELVLTDSRDLPTIRGDAAEARSKAERISVAGLEDLSIHTHTSTPRRPRSEFNRLGERKQRLHWEDMREQEPMYVTERQQQLQREVGRNAIQETYGPSKVTGDSLPRTSLQDQYETFHGEAGSTAGWKHQHQQVYNEAYSHHMGETEPEIHVNVYSGAAVPADIHRPSSPPAASQSRPRPPLIRKPSQPQQMQQDRAGERPSGGRRITLQSGGASDNAGRVGQETTKAEIEHRKKTSLFSSAEGGLPSEQQIDASSISMHHQNWSSGHYREEEYEEEGDYSAPGPGISAYTNNSSSRASVERGVYPLHSTRRDLTDQSMALQQQMEEMSVDKKHTVTRRTKIDGVEVGHPEVHASHRFEHFTRGPKGDMVRDRFIDD